ncbi:WD40-repeat-containing domain protein [Protomyces lactucae-debilis]|uniref:Pre-rRNA-processing protein IPI3 n=1 Tax=Protomyces lactucae-debilis TaxID=2754530 RepID=A0A1Y2ESR1_PROLT|nr:WD40-repeat-containing domain protein [Protomyces lactucae-debilis]ORY74603.1 WD40-repeat-containing domain protein [Protomyces lactucae-debilis]
METVATGSSEGSASAFISVVDLHTGTHLASLRESATAAHGVTSIQRGALLLAAQNDKSLVHVYRPLVKEGIDQKLIVPEKLDVLTASPCGTWLLGGAASGKLYLWELASGLLLFVKDAHYQGITKLLFTSDSKLFISASADATVQIWSVAQVLDRDEQQDLARPARTLKLHTLGITDMYIGIGTSTTARLYTASLDATVRIWDLVTGELLTTLLFISPVQCLAVDKTEHQVYVGLESGSVQCVKLVVESDRTHRAIGGMSSIVTAGTHSSSLFTGHEAAVSALSLNFDGSLLVSGDASGNVFVWDAARRQLVRRLKAHGSRISFIRTEVRPSVPVSEGKSTLVLPPLKRVQAERDLDEHQIWLKLASRSQSSFKPMADADAVLVGLQQLNEPAVGADNAEELFALQETLKKTQASYQELWQQHEALNKKYIASQF